MFVLQEEYSISENGRKFLGAVQTYLVLVWKPELFFFVFKVKKKKQSYPLILVTFAFPLGRKRQNFRKCYDLWSVDGSMRVYSGVRIREMFAREIDWIRHWRVIVFKLPLFTSIYATSRTKPAAFSKVSTLEVKISVVGGYSTNLYTRRLRPEVQPLTLLCTIFHEKGTPFIYLV